MLVQGPAAVVKAAPSPIGKTFGNALNAFEHGLASALLILRNIRTAEDLAELIVDVLRELLGHLITDATKVLPISFWRSPFMLAL